MVLYPRSYNSSNNYNGVNCHKKKKELKILVENPKGSKES
jgi:hypothetical protein